MKYWLIAMTLASTLSSTPFLRTAATADDKSKLDAYGDPLPMHAIARLGTVRFRHSAILQDFEFTSNGQTIWSWDFHSKIRAWQAATGELLKSFHFPNCGPYALTPDGQTLVGADDSGDLLIIDADKGQIQRRLRGHSEKANTLAISDDGEWLASATWGKDSFGNEQRLRVWELRSGRSLKATELPDACTMAMVFVPGTHRLLTIGSTGLLAPGALRSWDFAKGDSPETLVDAVWGSGVGKANLALGGKLLITGIANDSLVGIDTQSGARRVEFATGKVNGFGVSHDGRRLATAPQKQGPLTIWDVESGRRLGEIPVSKRSFGSGLRWSPNDKWLAFGRL